MFTLTCRTIRNEETILAGDIPKSKLTSEYLSV